MRAIVVLLLIASMAACAKKHEDRGDAGTSGGGVGGSSGVGGVGGSSGVGGVGGTSGSGGAGGTSGVGGSGGTSGVGGVGGSGGVGGVGGLGGVGGSGGSGERYEPECTSAADCVLVNDCCNCEAIPKDQQPPPACERLCVIDSCSSVGATEVACVAGRCVLDISCDETEAVCGSDPPQCPAGQTVSVRNGCFGGCVDAHECATVTGCEVCGADDVCVDSRGCDWGFHCIETPPECENAIGCECMSRACPSPPFCWDNEPGDRRLECGCEF